MPKKREVPPTIILISGYCYVVGVILLLTILLAILDSHLFYYLETLIDLLGIGYLGLILIYLFFSFTLFWPLGLLFACIIAGLAGFYFMIGKNIQKKWAKYFLGFFSIVSLIAGLSSPFLLGEVNIHLLLGLILPALTLFFLFTPSTKLFLKKP